MNSLVDPQRALPQIRHRREHRRPQGNKIVGLAVGEPRQMRSKDGPGKFAIRVARDQRQQPRNEKVDAPVVGSGVPNTERSSCGTAGTRLKVRPSLLRVTASALRAALL